MEKEQAYKDAAKNYENAWTYGNQSNPTIGMKRLLFDLTVSLRGLSNISFVQSGTNRQAVRTAHNP